MERIKMVDPDKIANLTILSAKNAKVLAIAIVAMVREKLNDNSKTTA
jgi:phosphoribosylcarboxyaminoimidazole (NCAIR) mutase